MNIQHFSGLFLLCFTIFPFMCLFLLLIEPYGIGNFAKSHIQINTWGTRMAKVDQMTLKYSTIEARGHPSM